jgi:magnesium chelatase family protein
MITKVKTLAHKGLEVMEVMCECHIGNGLPLFGIVGLADKSIQESRDRIRVILSELSNYDENIYYPYQRITVNLAPAEVIKKGNQFDLSILLSILCFEGLIEQKVIENSFFLGELTLNGTINQIDNIVSYCLYINEKYPNSKIFIPKGNEYEASYLTNGNIYAVENIVDILNILLNKSNQAPIIVKEFNVDEFDEMELKFEDIIGQKLAKRAIEIAAAGRHNLFLVGEQGSGKTLLSKALKSILPPLDKEELIEVAKIRSLVGMRTEEIMSPLRPFRTPHHTSSMISIMGGGSKIIPGEITKAHKGVLFLDELSEFDKRTLDSLRQPLEDKIINISRASGTTSYPCNFQLIATMNPTTKGGFENRDSVLNNSGMKKISGPILDRFDLQLKIFKPKNSEFNKSIHNETELIRNRVKVARKNQLKRFSSAKFNSDMTISEINKYCILDNEANEFLMNYKEMNNVSMRSFHKILKISRTLADLCDRDSIVFDDIIEAIQFRF